MPRPRCRTVSWHWPWPRSSTLSYPSLSHSLSLSLSLFTNLLHPSLSFSLLLSLLLPSFSSSPSLSLSPPPSLLLLPLLVLALAWCGAAQVVSLQNIQLKGPSLSQSSLSPAAVEKAKGTSRVQDQAASSGPVHRFRLLRISQTPARFLRPNTARLEPSSVPPRLLSVLIHIYDSLCHFPTSTPVLDRSWLSLP